MTIYKCYLRCRKDSESCMRALRIVFVGRFTKCKRAAVVYFLKTRGAQPRCYYRPQRSWGKVIFSEACVKNSVQGRVSRHTPRGEVGGVCLGGLRPTPRGEVGGSDQGGFQAHTWGGPSPGPGDIPACTEAEPPPQQMATAAGGTHPTGMHSWKLELITANGRIYSR